MRLRFLLALLALFLLVPVPGIAEISTPPPPVEVNRISGNLYELRCNGNVGVLASIGEDGTLLVDTGYQSTAPAVQEELVKLGGGPVSIIINTHGDGDHVGGNELLGDGAMIIAHPDVRRRMNTYFALAPDDSEGLPTVTLTREASLEFNGEKIRIIPVPGGHTAGDVVVHFTASNVVSLGDLILAGTFPNSDPARGGNAKRLLEVLIQLHDTLPPDTIFVTSHGGAISVYAFEEYIRMLEGTLDVVGAEIAAGYTLPEIVHRNPLALWWMWERRESGLSFENWTTEIYASLTGERVVSICSPLTEMIESDGVVDAIRLYHRLRVTEPERWNFSQRELNMLGYQLLARDRITDAIAIFELNVEAFPSESDTYDSLGEGYMAAGRIEESIASYEWSLELNSDNFNAVTILARLRS